MAERRFFNRDLSWLDFNTRVLEEAQRESHPLLERANFLAIVTSNLQEFAMVRLAELHRSRKEKLRDPAGMTALQQLRAVRSQMQHLLTEQYACWNHSIRPGLEQAGITIVAPTDWTQTDHETTSALWRDRLEAMLTPLAVDPTRPFPLLANRTITIGVLLDNPEKPGHFLRALVSVPAKERRLVPLVGQDGRYTLLEDVVQEHLADLFKGHTIAARCQFRIARDGEIDLDEDQGQDLLSEIVEGLRSRAHGRPVLLELRSGADERFLPWLLDALDLEQQDACVLDGPLDLTFGFGLPKLLNAPELEFTPFEARPCPSDFEDPFKALRRGDLLLHHPFESFDPIVRFVELAAADPKVLAIKQTLYRVSGESPIVKALIAAAYAGKQVTVMLELKARFDEAANVRWAQRLEQAGAHVIYGLKGLKVHAKALMIIRQDEDGIRRYCHLGSGNYNDRTAKIYTDFSLFTADEAVGQDLANLFNLITGFRRPPQWTRIAVAPSSLRQAFLQRIEREIEYARAGQPARIIAKFNSLEDAPMCEELYRASKAGVRIDLIVRGICILRPGVKGLSENIQVRSIVGRFLEHSRVYWFQNGGDPEVGIASADWMARNLDRRIETLVWIRDPDQRIVLKAILELYLLDSCQARILNAEGIYTKPKSDLGEADFDVQHQLITQRINPGDDRRPGSVPVKKPTASYVSFRRPRD